MECVPRVVQWESVYRAKLGPFSCLFLRVRLTWRKNRLDAQFAVKEISKLMATPYERGMEMLSELGPTLARGAALAQRSEKQAVL